MFRLPRVAVGAVGPHDDSQYMTWALMRLLATEGQQVQHFMSRACFPRFNGAGSATGNSSRHLDSWLMPPDLCREVFAHGCANCDLAVVEGRYETNAVGPTVGGASEGDSSEGDSSEGSARGGGRLDDLCEWLDLPRLVVLDATRLEDCRLPEPPQRADGLLIDRVSSPQHLNRLRTTLESLWGIPVLGGLETLPAARTALEALPRGSAPSRELCQTLADSLGKYAQRDRLRDLADRRQFPTVRPFLFGSGASAHGYAGFGSGEATGLKTLGLKATKLTVAVAFDEAFNCYFPDTLDLLELCGATVVDFSPLRDEALPPETDLVYFGCGHPERYAAALTENHCLTLALRDHLCGGGRVYAEGGGLAYLCQYMETLDGRRTPMIGAIPAVARVNPKPEPPRPIEVTLARRTWFGMRGRRLRGYLNTNWLIEPTGKVEGCLAEVGHECDLVSRYLALGSRLHVNFAAQPEFLRNFVRPSVERQSAG
jgi:cobyrinic acid a,c-diamide synthase